MAKWFDDFVGFFSPRAKANRIKYRYVAQQIEDHYSRRKYDGASKGRRTEKWKTPSSDANRAVDSGLSSLRDRSRDLIRNNPYAKRAQAIVTSNTVGWGITPQIKLENDQPRRKAQIEKLWNEWANSPMVDYDGRHNFYQLQSLVMNATFSDGEVLLRRMIDERDKLALPLRFQVLEADFLDTVTQNTNMKLDNGNFVIQGVEFSPKNERVAYWLFKEHPGGMKFFSNSAAGLSSQRVPANEILHVYDSRRPGQVRGVPWLDAAILRLRDFDDYEQAQLLRQKIAACHVGFVYDSAEPSNETEREAILGEKFEPGMIEILPPGRDIKFNSPPGVENYEEYQRAMLRAIAVSCGLTYELLTSDMGNVNFASGRMGWLEFQRSVENWRWQLIIPQFCDPAWSMFKTWAEFKGTSMAGVSATWSCPRREMIDPSKEIAATKDAVRSGFVSWPEAVRQMGYEPQKVLEEISQHNSELDRLGLVLDSDPRKSSQSGQPSDSGDESE